ncbi:PREDICTED: pentatricopeptide repeat-containing protein At5g66500, mitochondrial [Tarenaya hassleriana]|uniref:pentatricopeptide repeat-containing protein At5g66500, mitochondrial n=1 Tax=Tarenaya hassleriana TaxID=28532 RepID=UPI00053C0C6E|nr:PREDICTED: pentatricopeptide repeat-containing protein At5g66500, mitochondrial [Tarenaya hassleriana]
MFTCLRYGHIRYLGDIARRPTNFVRRYVSRHAHVHVDNVLDELPHRDVYSLNSNLSSYLRNGNPNATWALFLSMVRGSLELSPYSFTPVLGACSVLPYPERGRQVHALMIKHGAHSGVIAKTALIDMYSKYGQLGDSVKVFEDVRDKDVVSWNAMLSGCLRNGYGQEALGVFAEMVRENMVKPLHGQFFFGITVSNIGGVHGILRQGKQVHALVVVMGRDLVFSGTALIDFYSSVGLMSEAMKVYSSLNAPADEVMLNSLVSGCVENRRYNEAFRILCRIRPNVRALTSALAACSENTDLWIGRQIHCVAIRHGFLSDTQLCNVILDMYAKSGKILQARAVFEGVLFKDVVTWTSMIDAYSVHGHGNKALELFREMCEESSQVSPNSVTFLVVLSGCGHAGLVQEGKECLRVMKEKYGLVPGPEHYVCLIEMLSKSGDMEEIWKLLGTMKEDDRKTTAPIWAAILNACSHNMDVSRGEYAARRLMEMDPDNASSYVLVSNFYAVIEKWGLVNELRGVMKERGLLKAAGSSRSS